MDSSMNHIAHWDDAPSARFDVGPMGADWDLLGSAAGCDRVGLRRIRISSGKQSTPLHAHFGEEEIFYVLRGSGYSFQEAGCYELGEGDVVLHAHGGPAHTIVAGDDGIDVLAFGDNLRHEAVRFPRINATWMGGMVSEFLPVHQFQLEAERAGPVELPDSCDARPPTIVNVADVEVNEFKRGPTDATGRFIARRLGARRTSLNLCDIAPGATAARPHCHSAVEELFVVIGGEGVVRIGEEEHPVREGSLVCRPAGTGVPHSFHAGDARLTVLMYSDIDTNDMVLYPESGKVLLVGLGVVFKPEQVPYWDN
jgi:uncharacterized cupin superfamily protein